MIRDIVQGVRFLHSQNKPIIHGDLRAKNILVTRGYRAKLADFGLSQKEKTGAIIGTPFWMSPEVLMGKGDNSTASDIYALGVVFYELYARKDPYHELSTLEVLEQICDPSINRRPQIPKGCPPEVSQLTKSCWESNPRARPSAEDLDERVKLFHVQNVEPNFQRKPSIQKPSQQSSGDFLYQVFPKHIADALIRGEKVEPEAHECNIVNFTTISSTLSPLKLSKVLDRLDLALDALCKNYEIFKVETIGDAFMAVANLIEDQSKDHAKRIAMFSIEAIQVASQVWVGLDDPDKGFLQVRVGFHSGPVVSNVISSLNPRFGLFGDTVNAASRMESNSKPSRIHCSDDAAKLLREQAPEILIEDRVTMKVKGKGSMKTFFVLDDNWKTDEDTHSNLNLSFGANDLEEDPVHSFEQPGAITQELDV